jgi:hypothetical protein
VQLRKMTELEQRMAEDLDWARKAPEVQENPDHYGKFVVVCHKRVLGSGSDRKALVQEIADREHVPWRHLVVLIVPRPDFDIPPDTELHFWTDDGVS